MNKNGPLFFKKFSYGKNQPENGCVPASNGMRTWHTFVDNKLLSSPVQRDCFVV